MTISELYDIQYVLSMVDGLKCLTLELNVKTLKESIRVVNREINLKTMDPRLSKESDTYGRVPQFDVNDRDK